MALISTDEKQAILDEITSSEASIQRTLQQLDKGISITGPIGEEDVEYWKTFGQNLSKGHNYMLKGIGTCLEILGYELAWYCIDESGARCIPTPQKPEDTLRHLPEIIPIVKVHRGSKYSSNLYIDEIPSGEELAEGMAVLAVGEREHSVQRSTVTNKDGSWMVAPTTQDIENATIEREVSRISSSPYTA